MPRAALKSRASAPTADPVEESLLWPLVPPFPLEPLASAPAFGQLAFRLDTSARVVCARVSPRQDAPVSDAHLRCAMRHLYFDYSLVGVTARYDEYVCVLCEALGLEPLDVSKKGTYYADTPTNQHDRAPPADFVREVPCLNAT
jgi:hypothetical protein